MFQFSKNRNMCLLFVFYLKKKKKNWPSGLWDSVCKDFGIIVRERDETYLTRWALTIFKIITQLPLWTLVFLFKTERWFQNYVFENRFGTMFSKQPVLKMDDQTYFSVFGHICSVFKHWTCVFKPDDQMAS